MSEKYLSSLLPELRLLAARLQELEREAEKAGVFLAHRPLLQCATCGLREDLAPGGLLRTSFVSENKIVDSGLRFEEIENGFRYPSCPVVVSVPAEEEEG